MVEYGILQHGMMLGDTLRLGAYVDALRRVVRPGAVVVDIGSGTGVFALVACQAGARRVYAVEPGHVVHAAREIVAANGWADRIEFIPARSTEVTLPERADVVVLDVRGILPDEQMAIAADARRRLLKPEGTIIPALDTVWAALVSAPDAYDDHIGIWKRDEQGVDLRAVGSAMANARYKCRLRGDALVTDPHVVWRCDYAADDAEERRAILQWTLQRTAVAHGVAAWFDSVLVPGVEYSNRPGAPALLYGQAYFPWPDPIALGAGDEVQLELVVRADGQVCRWDWTTSVGSPSTRITRFEQTATIE